MTDGSYSVPPSSDQASSRMTGQINTTGGGDGSFQDLIVLYCSYFSYAPDGGQRRNEIILTPVNDIVLRIQRLEDQGVIAKGTAHHVSFFLEADENTQRELFDNPSKKKTAKSILYGFFDIIQNLKSDLALVFYCLAHLDGILEDDRERVEHFTNLSKDYKQPMPVIKILNQYIHQNTSNETLAHRDIASHILALMIEHESFSECQTPAREFLSYLML